MGERWEEMGGDGRGGEMGTMEGEVWMTGEKGEGRCAINAHHECHFNPIRSGLFQTVNDPGGGALKAPPPPIRSRKLLCQSSPYHTCEFDQVF